MNREEIKTGIELIADERREQTEKHGFDVKNNKYYKKGEIQGVVMCLVHDNWEGHYWYPENWGTWFKEKIEAKRARMSPSEFDIERLKIAGALLAAEIDRIKLKL